MDKATDVLSFPAGEGFSSAPGVLGDIVISLPTVFRQAMDRGITFYEELDFILIHGILHLLGYVHDTDSEARRMRRKENGIFKKIQGVRNSSERK